MDEATNIGVTALHYNAVSQFENDSALTHSGFSMAVTPKAFQCLMTAYDN